MTTAMTTAPLRTAPAPAPVPMVEVTGTALLLDQPAAPLAYGAVTVSGLRETGDAEYTAQARLLGFSTDVGHEPALMLEAARQAVAAGARTFYSAPLGSETALTFLQVHSMGPGPVAIADSLLLKITVTDRRAHHGTITALDHTVELFAHDALVGRVDVALRIR
ncbi:hypothetical protein E6W39_23540 [Kitasatospora acidiphila]|uniref:A-factor biosynthesis hotdog domain-containing protein n=1 Tax=Kitasatospora acidiphila TaxID=2567942 RepID=A0A540W6M0_9ACTN|nr:AfsA-related hotdog domain-containing protein [Kitasatospora acidiphila]TQF04650.1 hypothetical protein E6W39_23540 [Kitasatospora acidiphila]